MNDLLMQIAELQIGCETSCSAQNQFTIRFEKCAQNFLYTYRCVHFIIRTNHKKIYLERITEETESVAIVINLFQRNIDTSEINQPLLAHELSNLDIIRTIFCELLDIYKLSDEVNSNGISNLQKHNSTQVSLPSTSSKNASSLDNHQLIGKDATNDMMSSLGTIEGGRLLFSVHLGPPNDFTRLTMVATTEGSSLLPSNLSCSLTDNSNLQNSFYLPFNLFDLLRNFIVMNANENIEFSLFYSTNKKSDIKIGIEFNFLSNKNILVGLLSKLIQNVETTNENKNIIILDFTSLIDFYKNTLSTTLYVSSSNNVSLSQPASHWDADGATTLFWGTRFYQRMQNFRVLLLDYSLKRLHFYEPKLPAIYELAKIYSHKYKIDIEVVSALAELPDKISKFRSQNVKLGFITQSYVGHNIPFVFEITSNRIYLYVLDTLNYIGAKSATPTYNLMSLKPIQNFNIIDFHQLSNQISTYLSIDVLICFPYFEGESKGIRQTDNYSCGIDAIVILKDFLRIKNPSLNLNFSPLKKLESIVGNISVLQFKFPAFLCKTAQRSIFIKDMGISDSDILYDSRFINVDKKKQEIKYIDFRNKHYQFYIHRKLSYSSFWNIEKVQDEVKSTNKYVIEKGNKFYQRLLRK